MPLLNMNKRFIIADNNFVSFGYQSNLKYNYESLLAINILHQCVNFGNNGKQYFKLFKFVNESCSIDQQYCFDIVV